MGREKRRAEEIKKPANRTLQNEQEPLEGRFELRRNTAGLP
jgi:hypothetical protein